MRDHPFLHAVHALLKEYQEVQREPSGSVARVVLAVERELQGTPGNISFMIELLVMAGLLKPEQKSWAEEFYDRAPDSFREFVFRESQKIRRVL